MAKKIFVAIALLTITALIPGCGGGGSGNSSTPVGVNPNVPAIVQLLPVQYIAQTSSFVTFKAKVLNGNGNVMPGVGVNFTKLSLLGVMSSAYAVTDSIGIATVTVSSTTPGFATVQAEVNTGTGIVRDKRTVFFTDGSLNIQPFLVLDVDGNDSDTTYNETEDFNIFDNNDPSDNMVNIRATVYSGIGQPIAGTTVTFGADVPSTAVCTTNEPGCLVVFPFGDTVTTDANGQATVLVQINPAILSSVTTVLNITAVDNFSGAYNLVSLFLKPVTVGSVVLYANPTQVDSGGTSKITAAVYTNLNTPVPDGTVVSFTLSGGGSITPVFSETTDGMTAEIEYTAPVTTTNLTATVRGTAGGKTGSVNISVIGVPADLAVTPAAPSIAATGGTRTISFTVTGGVAPYNAASTNPTVAYNSTAGNGVWNGASFTVTVEDNALNAGTTVDINVNDATGTQVIAKISII